MRKVDFKRTTKETDIYIQMDPDSPAPPKIKTTVPFLDHMLTAMAFHGRFALTVEASGDTDVDPHHLVEDAGLVLGEVLLQIQEKDKRINRYAHSVIPMDEALSEVIIDICGRPTLVYKPDFPQPYAGLFDLSLMREFFIALATRSKISLHVNLRYGENSHHMIEAAFKALGKAIKQAYGLEIDSIGTSTKGTLS